VSQNRPFCWVSLCWVSLCFVSSHPFYACHISICSKVLEIGCEQFSAAVCTSRRVYITQVSMDKNVSKRNYSLLTLVPRILQQQKEIITERSVETILFVIAPPNELWQVEKHNRSPWGCFTQSIAWYSLVIGGLFIK